MMVIDYPILVEGTYDRQRLLQVVDAHVITTNGFGIFRDKEKRALLRRLAEPRGVIVLTDSDRAGGVIRGHLSGILPKDKIIHLYTPQIAGKEHRKRAPSKDGLLGVEGMDAELLRSLLAPFASDAPVRQNRATLTKQDFYADGLSGGAASSALRTKLAHIAGLPTTLSANALLAAINLLFTEEDYRTMLKKAKEE